jgi:hypothetical protein
MTINVPREYLNYIDGDVVTEAFLNCEFPSYMRLWPLDKIHEYNRDHNVAKYAPGFLCFGSNGGGELLAFDKQGVIYCLPAIGMEPKQAVRVAGSWTEFVGYISAATSPPHDS